MRGQLPSKAHVNYQQFTAVFGVACKLPCAVANLKFHINLQCCLLTKIPLVMQCHTLGSTESLLFSFSLSHHIYISVNLNASLSLLLIIVCVLPSSRSPWWTGGHVARAPLGDASSCAVVSWICSLYVYLYQTFC